MKKLYKCYIPEVNHYDIDFFDEKEIADYKADFPKVQFTEYVVDKNRKGTLDREEINGVIACSQELYDEIITTLELNVPNDL